MTILKDDRLQLCVIFNKLYHEYLLRSRMEMSKSSKLFMRKLFFDKKDMLLKTDIPEKQIWIQGILTEFLLNCHKEMRFPEGFVNIVVYVGVGLDRYITGGLVQFPPGQTTSLPLADNVFSGTSSRCNQSTSGNTRKVTVVRDEYKLYRTFDFGIPSVVNRASPR